MSSPPAIVIPCYNRAYSLKRLLHSVAGASYPEDSSIPLIISIDPSENTEVSELCEQFVWKYGDKIIIRHEEHLGLKRHVIKCGDLSEKYGSVIILEDDLMVSPWFYEFAIRVSAFYQSSTGIAGIALYSYRFTENNFYPFYPVEDGSDVYFMQLPCSWGQLFNSTQWSSFKKWYENHREVDESLLPGYINQWSASSWKKHFTHYLIDTDKYFVFPCFSFITNFSEPGANSDRRGIFQVPLSNHPRDLKFVSLHQSGAVYDSDFEILPRSLNGKISTFRDYSYTVDMYGTKNLADIKTHYLLSSKKCSNPIASFGNDLSRALDNIIYGTEGNFYSFGRTIDFSSTTPPENEYYPELNAIKDLAFNSYINERITADRFRIDYPYFHFIIDPGSNESELQKTLDSIQSQNYPHKGYSVIKIDSKSYGDIEVILSNPHSTYFCILKSGDTVVSGALGSINAIFKRYPEIFWLTGIQAPENSNTPAEITGNISHHRWNKNIFEKRKVIFGTSGIPASATFWRKDVWDSAKADICFTSAEHPTEDIWPAFFEKHFLHTAVIPVSISLSKTKPDILKGGLLENNPIASFWEYCFKKDIRYLRSVYKDRQKLLPVIRFDKASDSFYFSEY